MKAKDSLSSSDETAAGEVSGTGGRPCWSRWLLFGCLVAGILGYGLWRQVKKSFGDAQVLIVVGQSEVRSGGALGLRIVVRNRHTGRPVSGAQVRVRLLPDRPARSSAWRRVAGPNAPAVAEFMLGTFRTDAEGTVPGELSLPAVAPGRYALVVEAVSPLGRDRIQRRVRVTSADRLLLTCDKPLYQPGQTVRLRVLAQTGPKHHPRSGASVTFEIRDANGNKVFRAHRLTSRFGIAAADFELARELNLGRYHLLAWLGAGADLPPDAPHAERTFAVRRYVLPKFKLALTLAQGWCRPGETVRGTLTARYFFGRPVAGATVRIRAERPAEAPVELGQTTGRTDAAGRWRFALPLPDTFTGNPSRDGHALLELTAEVTDPADQTEQTTVSFPVVSDDLELRAFPEMGQLAPGLENRIYVLTSRPDGQPVACRIRVADQEWRSGEDGLALVRWRPAETEAKILIEAEAPDGARATTALSLTNNAAALPLILRTERPVYTGGETVRGTLWHGPLAGPIFLDALHERRTLKTQVLRTPGSPVTFALTLPPDVAGVVELNAYVLDGTGTERGVSRLIIVRPSGALRLQVTPDRETYRPGATARWRLRVTDRNGHPTPAALGVSVVDEAVFALAEPRTGPLAAWSAVQRELLERRAQSPFAAPPQWLRAETAPESWTRAWLAARQTRELRRRREEAQRLSQILGRSPDRIERSILALRGTPVYDLLKQDEHYGPLITLVEQGSGVHTLVASTYAEKRRRAEYHRRQVEEQLTLVLLILVPGGLMSVVFFFTILGENTGLRHDLTALSPDERKNHAKLAVAHQIHWVLTGLALLPLLGYPLSMVAGALFAWARSWPWAGIMLAGETVLVGWAFVRLRARARRVWQQYGEPFPHSILTTLNAYLIFFLVSRGSGVLLVVAPPAAEFPVWMGLVISTIVAPLLLVMDSQQRVQAFLERYHIRDTRGSKCSPGLLLGLVVFCLLLVGMLLPALAKAKGKAQRINLQNDLKQLQLAQQIGEAEAASATNGAPRLRRDFPETLFWQPELITDDRGQAVLEIPLADSITTWRVRFDGVDAQGQRGATNLPLRVFQPFFVDLNLPAELTLHDAVEAPVVCYNYLDTPQTVRLRVAPDEWFESPRAGRDFAVTLAPGAVRSVALPLKLIRVGEHRLRVTATADGARVGEPPVTDAVERVARVRPAGRKVERVENLVLRDRAERRFDLPPDHVPGSATLWLKLYPSRFSEVLEGIESLFAAPHGCFEQTSSVTYPNALALAYLRKVDRLTPAVEEHARRLINEGYQHLLTFEVPGGGFEWFGQPPANVCLTAYGVLEFTDLARVQAVDPAILRRAVTWLAAQQEEDGAWKAAPRGWRGPSRSTVTAFTAWALAEAGVTQPTLERALAYLRGHFAELRTPYDRALAANALLAADRADPAGRRLLAQLRKAGRIEGQDRVFWRSDGRGVMGSWGCFLDVETTALVAMALLKDGDPSALTTGALTWLSAHKQAHGGWGSTQATILALRALLLGTDPAGRRDTPTDVRVRVNGSELPAIHLTADCADLLQTVDLTPYLKPGRNRVVLTQTPSPPLTVQLVATYWRPETESAPERTASAPGLSIEQQYDRRTLAVGDCLRCTVTVRTRGKQPAPMVLVVLGIPPGFSLEPADFAALVADHRIAHWGRKGTHVYLYLRALEPDRPLQFTYRLRAQMPLRVTAPPAEVYEYYAPRHRARAAGTWIEVSERPSFPRSGSAGFGVPPMP